MHMAATDFCRQIARQMQALQCFEATLCCRWFSYGLISVSTCLVCLRRRHAHTSPDGRRLPL